MKTVVLFYRRSPELRREYPRHPLNNWRVLLVDEDNSERNRDGSYELVSLYQNDPMWEVHTVTTTLPA